MNILPDAETIDQALQFPPLFSIAHQSVSPIRRLDRGQRSNRCRKILLLRQSPDRKKPQRTIPPFHLAPHESIHIDPIGSHPQERTSLGQPLLHRIPNPFADTNDSVVTLIEESVENSTAGNMPSSIARIMLSRHQKRLFFQSSNRIFPKKLTLRQMRVNYIDRSGLFHLPEDLSQTKWFLPSRISLSKRNDLLRSPIIPRFHAQDPGINSIRQVLPMNLRNHHFRPPSD